MQVSEWHNRSAKVGGIRRDCLREQGDPGARQLPRVSTSLARLSSRLVLSRLLATALLSLSALPVCLVVLLSLRVSRCPYIRANRARTRPRPRYARVI